MLCSPEDRYTQVAQDHLPTEVFAELSALAHALSFTSFLACNATQYTQRRISHAEH